MEAYSFMVCFEVIINKKLTTTSRGAFSLDCLGERGSPLPRRPRVLGGGFRANEVILASTAAQLLMPGSPRRDATLFASQTPSTL